jgi:hypothetical protein
LPDLSHLVNLEDLFIDNDHNNKQNLTLNKSILNLHNLKNIKLTKYKINKIFPAKITMNIYMIL